MRVAFYAPMKPPDDPVPSGDRTMARALMAALSRGGHEVTVASRLRTHLHAPDPDREAALTGAAEAEAARIARVWAGGGRPDLWFTYHNYHKAPDLLGPPLCRQYGLPYALAEASHAAKRAAAWTDWFAAAEAASRAADLHLCLTARDRAGITPLLRSRATVADLPPFLDLDGVPEPKRADVGAPRRLVTIAMMRPGDKLDSYRFLAEALATIPDHDWSLDLIGDGPARAAVEAAFARVPAGRVRWWGACGSAAVRRHLADADIFVWPGFGEAFGLAYLEAQAAGLPVVALDIAGVPSVVLHGRTGLLVAAHSPAAFAAAITDLMDAPQRCKHLGRTAAAFVRTERSLAVAAEVLDAALQAAVTQTRERHAG